MMEGHIGEEFMLFTRNGYLGETEQSRGLPHPPVEQPYDPAQPCLPLPDPLDVNLPPLDFLALLAGRTSVRKYAQDSLTLPELSCLLWSTQGVKQVIADGVATLRTVPSAGARHAFETYLLINRVESLAPGLYRYLSVEHALLLQTDTAEIADTVKHACLGQKMVSTSAVTFIWTAVARRMTWRYGQRGYRYLHLDAGHVCQNLYLTAEALNCGACAIAAFDDDALNAVLGIDGQAQFAIYVAALGKKI